MGLRAKYAVALVCLLLAPAGRASGELFPRPAELQPQVDFWTRIYTEVDGQGGLIHDTRHMDVVYEHLRFPAGLSYRARERKLEAVKKNYANILKRLAKGKRKSLSSEESRVLALWPAGVTNKQLSSAAHRVRFQLGQADKFRTGIVRSGKWMRHIQQVFARHGLPQELAALPHVESSFTPTARSSAGAAGIWQFTRATGRRFMRVDHVIDERWDPYLATEAAARLLKENYEITGSWPLAITAYNHGAAGMRRAARQLGTRDIATIVKSYNGRTFGFASRNFYTEFLAALEIQQNAEKYFGPLELSPEFEVEVVRLDHYYPAETLHHALSLDLEVLKTLNPSLLAPVWSGQKLVPRNFELRIPRRAESPANRSLAAIPAKFRFAKQIPDRNYKVRRGDTLSVIARRFGVSQSQLVEINGLRSRHRIHVGQKLKLPNRHAPVSVASTRRAPLVMQPAPTPEDGIYRVKRGDTLSIIAARFGADEKQLKEWNKIRNANRIAIGQEIRLRPETIGLAAAETPAPTETEIPAVPSKPAAATSNLAPSAFPFNPARFDPTGESIVAEPEETLGHYADWLELPTQRLRDLNHMGHRTPLAIGRKVRVDYSKVDAEEFQRRRVAYHRAMHTEFFRWFEVHTLEEHVLEPGDTLWHLARGRYAVPIWLLHHYNPGVNFSALQPGTRIRIPRVDTREST